MGIAVVGGTIAGVLGSSSVAEAATSVKSVTVSLDSSATGALTTYAIGFTTSASGDLEGSAGATVTITLPTGSDASGLTGSTTFTVAGSTVGYCSEQTTTTVQCNVYGGDDVPDNTAAVVQLDGVVNPGSGSKSLTVSTTADTAAKTSPSYTIGAAHAVTTPSVTLTSSAAGALGDDTIGFTTSGNGILEAADGSSVTITFPSGTSLDNLYGASDVEVGGSTVGYCDEESTNVAQCFLYGGQTVAGGSAMSIDLLGVTNPSQSSYTLSVATSSDTSPSSSSYAITAAQSVSTPSVALDSTAAGGLTDYTVGFTTSSTGQLDWNDYASAITVTFPDGTSLANLWGDSSVQVSGTTVGYCSEQSASVAQCSLNGDQSIPAGTPVTLDLLGVTNPGTGSASLSVATATDVLPASSSSYAITAAQSVSTPSVALDSTAAGGLTDYTVGFTTSSTGQLDWNDYATAVTVTFPSGTSLDNLYGDSTVEVAGSTVGYCYEQSTSVAQCYLNSDQSIPAGTPVTLDLLGVTNPGTGPASLSVTTGTDTLPATSSSYTITAAQSVSALSLSLNSTAAGGLTDYNLGFTTSSSGALDWDNNDNAITITLPTGTNTSSMTGYSGIFVSGTQVGACYASAPTVATCYLYGDETIPASTAVSVELAGVTNPSAGNGTVKVTTVTDTVATTANETIATAKAVTTPTVSLSSNAPGASGVTYKVGFKTSTTGRLDADAGSFIKITAPTGTAFDGGGTVTVAGTTVGYCENEGPALAECFLYGGESIPAATTVSVELDGVTNPVAGSYTLGISTSSDTKSLASPKYTIANPKPPVVKKLKPASGPVGKKVTIIGVNLGGAMQVEFHGTPAVITTDTATKIVTTVPAGATTGSITVQTGGGTTTSTKIFKVT